MREERRDRRRGRRHLAPAVLLVAFLCFAGAALAASSQRLAGDGCGRDR